MMENVYYKQGQRMGIRMFIIFFIVFLLCFPVFAAETEADKFYITEETTHWDVVEATNPNHDEIPDEIKQQMKESYVISRSSAFVLPGMFIAVSYETLVPIGIGVILVIAVLIFVYKSKRL